jgi:hypothetical protein
MKITIGTQVFRARLETALAPRTCAAFLKLLPFRQRIIQARWSGEACWVPLGDFRLDVGTEAPVHRPAPGQVLFYPGGISETEILVPYGRSAFACKDGPLEGNHFLTILEGPLEDVGRRVLWEGAQPIAFEAD